MLKHKPVIAMIALLLGFALGAGSVYWCFNHDTRPWRYQSGIHSVHGQTGEYTFEKVVFIAPPVVELSRRADSIEAQESTLIVETTTKGFQWKNVGKSANSDGTLDFEARGRISREQAEKLGLKWTPFSSWQLW